ncbi:MAG: DUF167 domain-containing protein [Myxococcota bacterium]
MGLDLRERADGVEVRIHVHPRSAKESVGGLHGGALRVRVSAPPLEGQANEAICRVLARALGLRSRCVRLVAGAQSREKWVRLDGAPAELCERLRRLAAQAQVV